MFTATIHINLDNDHVLSELREITNEAIPIYYFESIDNENIRFVMDAGEHRDAIATVLQESDAVQDVRYVSSSQLVITKRSSGVLPIIRANHGMFQKMSQFDGTQRTFDVIVFSREELKRIIEELRELGDVHLGRLRPIGDPTLSLSTRQLEVITLANEAGYFDWPRRADAETLADELGISHATFLEHLRKAERKLIDEVLGTALPTGKMSTR